MAGEDRPDLCVIGGGSAGHAVALAAAALGARCTLIDPAERLGAGQAADLAEAMLLREAIGRRATDRLDWPAFRRRVGLAMTADHANHTAARLATVGVTVLRGTARFADARTVQVDGTTIRARRFIVATGASIQMPLELAGLARGALVRPADLLAGDTLPAAIGIVVTIPAGLAWAQALARLGIAVTLRLDPGALGAFDPELMQPVLDALRREGVAFADPATTAGSVLLVAGRTKPATAGLGLAEAGIACRPGGAPVVDRRLRTTNPRVYAVGDVLGGGGAADGATAQQVGLVLRTALFRLPVWTALPPCPHTLRTDPPVSQVGLLFAAEVAAGGTDRAGRGAIATALRASSRWPSAGDRHVLRFPLAEVVPGLPGLAKIVASRSGRIRGVGLVGPGAPDAIAPWVQATARGVPVGSMAMVPVPPGTLAEAGRRAALGFVTARLRRPWIRRLVVALRRLP